MAGKSLVGPDGQVWIGPYGAVRVAGLTVEQARATIANHLAPVLGPARVTVESEASATVVECHWRAANPGPALQPDTGIASNWRPVTRHAGAPQGVVTAANWQTGVPATDPGLTRASTFPAPRACRAAAESEPAATAPEPLAQPRSVPITPIPGAPGPEPGAEVVANAAPGPACAAGHPGPGGLGDGVPRELSRVVLPTYRIEPPDILLVDAPTVPKEKQTVTGQHLVRMDGTIGLGIFGSAYVAGLTIEEAREAVAQAISRSYKVKAKDISVDVLAFNSKVYYVITDGAGYGQQVVRLPITGGETVLDAVSLIQGLSPVSSKKRIWVARRHPGHGGDQVLAVDWIDITKHGSAATNYQIFPGDRIYIDSEGTRKLDSALAKIFSPIERVFGVTLLGSQTVQSLQGRTSSGSGTTGR
jgi:polysaccharide export outer membrane protein